MAESTHKNEVMLSGIVSGTPEYSHENHKMRFLKFPLRIRRLSGQEDELVIVAAEHLPGIENAKEGEGLCIVGQLRSYNHRETDRNRLILSVYAREIHPCEEMHHNEILLCGVLCKLPHRRSTPLGREICDVMLAVNRVYGRADYIPCIAWGRLAEKIGEMQVGDGLSFEGRIQSRCYQKLLDTGVEQRVAYEVSVMRLCGE